MPLALLAAVASCTSLKNGREIDPSSTEAENIRSFVREAAKKCIAVKKVTLAGSLWMRGGTAAFEALSSTKPKPLFALDLVSPIGSPLATWQTEGNGEAASSRCLGRCPAAVAAAFEGLRPQEARALLCGTPALAEPQLAVLDDWRLDPGASSLAWFGSVALFGERRSARVELRLSAEVGCQRGTEDSREGAEGCPPAGGDCPAGLARAIKTTVRTRISMGWWSRKHLDLVWESGTSCSRHGWRPPQKVALRFDDNGNGAELTIRDFDASDAP